MITDKYLIREQNVSLVLQTIIEKQPISRADISKLSLLNKATVSSIISSLLEKQLILEAGVGEASSTGGRKPVYLTFNPQAGISLAIDIGYNYINTIVTYLDGTKIFSNKYKLALSQQNLIDELTNIIDYLLETAPKSIYGVVGMAIAIHGISINNDIIFSPFYNITGTTLYDYLSQKYQFPIFIENEANLAALGEYTFTYENKNIISVSIHSGIGVGIIQDNQLQTGTHGHAGEIGHTILYKNGIPCSCGNKGCLEKYTSNTAIYQSYGSHYKLDNVDSDIITSSLRANDPFTTNLIQEKITELSVGINTLIVLYDPEVIIINSSIFHKNKDCLRLLNENINTVFAKNLSIQISKLGENATLLGGIAFISNHFLKISAIKFKNVYSSLN